MATHLHWICLGICVSMIATAGCQTSNVRSSRASARIPVPSFDGPKIAPGKSAPSNIVAAAPSGPAAWTPRVAARPWKWIVIHHSASPTGSMALFDKEHRSKGWDGVGYHFVIGNGTNSADGQVEVTPRWPVQKWGAHAKSVDNRYNEFGIGICLVGNFDKTNPTPKQMASLEKLVVYLMQTYHIQPQFVIGHRDTKPTECPGRNVNVSAIRNQANRIIAAGRSVDPSPAQTAKMELLGDISR